MRSGGQRTMGANFDERSVDDQISVLHALREHAVDHAVRWGLSVHTLIDVPTAGWPDQYSTWWQQACRRVLGADVSFSPHSEAAGSQTEAVHRVLTWATKSLDWQWDALLMTRPDLMLRTDLPLPCNVDAIVDIERLDLELDNLVLPRKEALRPQSNHLASPLHGARPSAIALERDERAQLTVEIRPTGESGDAHPHATRKGGGLLGATFGKTRLHLFDRGCLGFSQNSCGHAREARVRGSKLGNLFRQAGL